MLLALLSFLPVSAESELASARRAAELLGHDVWSRVLVIENRSTGSVYPRTACATVFELGGMLWFYSPVNGTQSFSLHRGRLAAEKADLAPLLRAIDPGFTRHSVLPCSDRWAKSTAPLPNGCFIESYVALRECLERGEPLDQARLLSFYVRRSGRLLGHTVLAYSTPEGVFVLDPASSDRKPQPLAGVQLRRTTDARDIAVRICPELRIAEARWVPAALVPPLAGGSALRHANADQVR